jgi:hypothetical protein
MKVVTKQDIQQESCGHYITVAKKGEVLTVICEGFGHYTVVNSAKVEFIISKNQAEPL